MRKRSCYSHLAPCRTEEFLFFLGGIRSNAIIFLLHRINRMSLHATVHKSYRKRSYFLLKDVEATQFHLHLLCKSIHGQQAGWGAVLAVESINYGKCELYVIVNFAEKWNTAVWKMKKTTWTDITDRYGKVRQSDGFAHWVGALSRACEPYHTIWDKVARPHMTKFAIFLNSIKKMRPEYRSAQHELKKKSMKNHWDLLVSSWKIVSVNKSTVETTPYCMVS